MKKIEAFILMDSLVAFLMISGFVLFFNQIVYISTKEQFAYQQEVKSLNYLREGAYEYYLNDKIIHYEDEEIKTYIDNGHYCVEYPGMSENEKICI